MTDILLKLVMFCVKLIYIKVRKEPKNSKKKNKIKKWTFTLKLKVFLLPAGALFLLCESCRSAVIISAFLQSCSVLVH